MELGDSESYPSEKFIWKGHKSEEAKYMLGERNQVERKRVLKIVLISVAIVIVTSVILYVVAFSLYTSKRSSSVTTTVSLHCTLNGEGYIYEITYDDQYRIITAGGDSWIADYVQTEQYDDANILMAQIEDYFIVHGGTCEIIKDGEKDIISIEEWEVPSPMEKPSTMEAYATVLGEYYTVLAENWDAGQVMETGLNYMVADCHHGTPLEDIGYQVMDLDGDAVEELLIGSKVEDEFFGKMIFSLYTLDADGVAMLIFDSSERNRYYYAGGIHFANIGSSGWNDSFVTTLKFEDNEMIDMTYTTEPSEYVQMELISFGEWIK